MLQIKTIKNRLDNAEDFDKAVNTALAEGWTLTKREVLPPVDLGGYFTHTTLYAELERVEITEAERGCENCRYCDCDATLEPCCNCSDNADKWEAADA